MIKSLIIAFALAATLSAADFSGAWSGKGGSPDPKYGLVPVTAQMTLVEATVTGTLTGTMKIANGKPFKISGVLSGGTLVFAMGTGESFSLTPGGSTQLSGKYTSSTGQVVQLLFTKQ